MGLKLVRPAGPRECLQPIVGGSVRSKRNSVCLWRQVRHDAINDLNQMEVILGIMVQLTIETKSALATISTKVLLRKLPKSAGSQFPQGFSLFQT